MDYTLSNLSVHNITGALALLVVTSISRVYIYVGIGRTPSVAISRQRKHLQARGLVPFGRCSVPLGVHIALSPPHAMLPNVAPDRTEVSHEV